MTVDLQKHPVVLQEMATTNLRPDLVLWSEARYGVYFMQLTVPWEDAVEMTNER